MRRCVIFAAGPVEAPERLKEMWHPEADDLYIAADGGLRSAALLGIEPHILLGDMDSLGGTEIPKGARVYPVRKDDTDTMLAVKTGIEEGCDEFLIFGALGGRLDHTYANIQTLSYLLDHDCSGTLLDGGHLCTMIRDGSIALDTEFKHLSVFSYSDRCEGVSISGTGYPLDGGELTSGFPLGVSNYQIPGERAVVTVDKGTLLLILSSHL